MYHVRISTRSEPGHDETKLDLDEQQLRDQFLAPYEQGKPIVLNGRVIPMEDLARIRISYSDLDTDRLRSFVEERDRRSSVVVVGGPSTEWQIAREAQDVTNQFIKGPPGSAAGQQVTSGQLAKPKAFIAHTGNSGAFHRLLRFLTTLGVDPQVAEWLPSSGAHIPDHVRSIYQDCACAIVFAEAIHRAGGKGQTGTGVLIEVGLLQSHFSDRIIYLREEGVSFGPMADSYVAEFFTQDNLEAAFQKIVLELKAWGLI